MHYCPSKHHSTRSACVNASNCARCQANHSTGWDLNHNQELKWLHFVPFMLLIKGDTVEHDKHTVEHDKHTVHYGARTRGVKCLCRCCSCPSDRTDEAAIVDWILVVELQIMFEAWLTQPKMEVNAVVRPRQRSGNYSY